MTTLEYVLERLGLQQYHASLVTEGFDTWETVLDIQESDLVALDVKLGHRRKLQRAIAEYRGVTNDRPLNSPGQDGPTNDNAGPDGNAQRYTYDKDSASSNKEQKRRYRRHPKPDEYAPEKPPSAYVLFSNKVRDEVKSQNLSFTEIARLVGEKWQKLDPDEKSVFETRASDNKDEYNRLLADYKKTPQHKQYMEYLADFRAKHGGQNEGSTADAKRPKLNPDGESSHESSRGDDYPDDFQTRLDHDRAGSVSSVSTASRAGPQQTTSLQIVTSLPRMSAEVYQRSPTMSKALRENYSSNRTPVQNNSQRQGAEYPDGDHSSYATSIRHESPSTDSVSGQSVSQDRMVDGEQGIQNRRSQSQYNTFSYPSARASNLSSDLNLPPIKPGPVSRNRQNIWDPHSPEASRQTYNTIPGPIQQSITPSQQSPRPPDSNQFSPISQVLNSQQDFGERTLPPIHRLSTQSVFPGSPPNNFSAGNMPPSPDHPLTRRVSGPEQMAFRPGAQHKPEPHLSVNVGEADNTGTRQLNDSRSQQQPQPRRQGNHYVDAFDKPGSGSSRYR